MFRESMRCAGALACAAAVISAAAGCQLGQLAGGMADSYLQTATKKVQPEYAGLAGKSFAVVVAADEMIRMDHPDAVQALTLNVGKRLADNAGASGWVPPQDVLRYQVTTPRWVAMPPEDLAKELGVDRLIFIDLQEYRLHEPGNPYVWEGKVTGRVMVVEADAVYPADFAFQDQVSVSFPDTEGMGPMQIPQGTIEVALLSRFVDRATWLFYEHEEKVRPEY